ncbi:helix-turn-helix domain-containing protein [Flavobacterium sp. UBA7682]|uniref:helix-turn-helix domain-containing protein n=1 Tax=Flavobacterium sp. UBA7682 TaxID=1946560 RepID=UPI0025C5AC49|nr:helix-turn-helix transcriptional regulator [Flavobacterium sp. UBA7682]
METNNKPKHLGRNISRIRELRQMKQEALAMAIGVSQQTISTIENSETVDDDKLKLIAEALGVSVVAIKNFTEDAMITYFNNFNDHSVNNGQFSPTNCTFNPLDKLMEAHDENKQLYERLLQAEKDKVAYLEKLLDK